MHIARRAEKRDEPISCHAEVAAFADYQAA